MNNSISQPLWYHPTNVMLVDDDEKFLRSLGKQIDPMFPFTGFTNPLQALSFIEMHTVDLDQILKLTIKDSESADRRQALSGESIAINFNSLKKIPNNPDRFTKFSTIIVDKIMPEMDGLEFCKKIRKQNLPVKLILLTGNAGAEEAIQAFNERIIDAFVMKTSNDMMNQLNNLLHELSVQNFIEYGTQLFGSVLNKISPLKDPSFISFFKRISETNNIIEHYITDSSCSFFIINKSGLAKLLLIKSYEDFENALEIAINDNAPGSLIDGLKNRRSFPSPTEESHLMIEAKKWEKFLVPMSKIDNMEMYFSLVDINEKLPSFEKYIDEVWKPRIIKK